MTTTPCTGCAVQQGTHQPAEALHQIAEPKTQHPEALRLAQHLEQFRSFPDDLAAADELRRQHARIAELEQRLEIDPRHRYDGISARDATIAAQDERIEDLESQLEAIGAGGVEPLRKPASTAAAPAPDERAAFEAWLGIKPCGAAHDFGWAAWQARAALAVTQAAKDGDK